MTMNPQDNSAPQAQSARSPEATDYSPHTQPGSTDKVRIHSACRDQDPSCSREGYLQKTALRVAPGRHSILLHLFPAKQAKKNGRSVPGSPVYQDAPVGLPIGRQARSVGVKRSISYSPSNDDGQTWELDVIGREVVLD